MPTLTSSNWNFKDKVVLVTGAATGIGRDVAVRLAKAGSRLVLSDVNEDICLQTVQMAKEAGAQVHFFKCDVSREENVKALVSFAVQKYGRLDIACNNAGVEGEQKPTADCTFENWDKVINTNLKGVWMCMKYQIPEMIKSGGGTIVNISSIAGLIGFSGLPAYVASKHGVIGLTKTAALEYAANKIRVNAICPGPIMTPMLKRLMDTTPGFTDAITAGVPQKRIGEPSEVSETILFLCSDQASYITGQALAVDGGWVAQ